MALPRTTSGPGHEPEPVMQVLGRMTYDEYCQLPEDGKRYELIGGVLHVPPAPGWEHQFSALALARMLADHVDQFQLGRVGIAPFETFFSEDDVVQPDVLYISNERLSLLSRRRLSGGPTLVVEVLSPSTRAYDTRTKRAVYARYGVQHYWLLDPLAHWLEAYELRDGEYVLIGRWRNDDVFEPALFPGLQIPLAKLWEPMTLA